jgi:site-specific DNA recombinase
MFPENIVFDGCQHRTKRLNEIINIISLIDRELKPKKNGTSHLNFDLSHIVIPLGLEPRAHTLKVYCSTN